MSASISRSNNNNRNNNRNNLEQSVKKPFCKVCFDAGKPENLYASHCVRNPKYVNVVVCPTLLAQACLTCGKKGHMSSRCSKGGGEQPNKKVVVKVCIEKKRAGAGAGAGANGFAALMDKDEAVPKMTRRREVVVVVVAAAAVPKNKSWVEMDNETEDEDEEEDKDDYDAYYKEEYYSDF